MHCNPRGSRQCAISITAGAQTYSDSVTSLRGRLLGFCRPSVNPCQEQIVPRISVCQDCAVAIMSDRVCQRALGLCPNYLHVQWDTTSVFEKHWSDCKSWGRAGHRVCTTNHKHKNQVRHACATEKRTLPTKSFDTRNIYGHNTEPGAVTNCYRDWSICCEIAPSGSLLRREPSLTASS